MIIHSSFIVAVKVIPLAYVGTDPNFLELLKREIEIMQKIKHPNIVRMYDAARTKHNLYMFLEYCKDGDLSNHLMRRQNRLSERESVDVLKQIVEGFKTLYANNIVHRDIKPANIMLHEGVAKITDFGFARVIDANMEDEGVFSKVGTPL